MVAVRQDSIAKKPQRTPNDHAYKAMVYRRKKVQLSSSVKKEYPRQLKAPSGSSRALHLALWKHHCSQIRNRWLAHRICWTQGAQDRMWSGCFNTLLITWAFSCHTSKPKSRYFCISHLYGLSINNAEKLAWIPQNSLDLCLPSVLPVIMFHAFTRCCDCAGIFLISVQQLRLITGLLEPVLTTYLWTSYYLNIYILNQHLFFTRISQNSSVHLWTE